MSPDTVFDYLAVQLNSAKAAGVTMVVNWAFSDLAQSYRMNLTNTTLTVRANRHDDHADATVALERAVLDRLALREITMAAAIERGLATVTGDSARIVGLFELFDDTFPMFEVVEPKREA